MDIKDRIADFIKQLLMEHELTQRDLADMLGIGAGRLSAYVKGKELPRIEIIIKLADIGGLTVDDLVRTNKPPEKKAAVIPIKRNPRTTANRGGENIRGEKNVIGGDVTGGIVIGGGVTGGVGNTYNNTTIRPQYGYVYQQGDLTEEQASKIKTLVEEIVELEKRTSKNPKSYAAIYNILKKKFKVVYYRKIREEDFFKAEAYLKAWKGRLLRGMAFPEKDSDIYRKERYKAIFAAAKNQLGIKKADIDAYIFSEYGVPSITELDNNQLESLYATIMKAKKKR